MSGRATQTHLRRYRQIADVLVRHGLGYMVGALGLERFVPFHRGLFGHPRRALPYTQPEHVRLALEELGTTFIKLGQIVSTRPDLVPPNYLVELAKLQDAAPPVAAEAIRQALLEELGSPVETVFARFDLVPLAAASIGQAHAASLTDGTEVVVKIRRPGVFDLVEVDLDILQNLAATASRRWDVADQYGVVGLAQEFAAALRAELDYLREGRNVERFAAAFADATDVHIPRVYWEATTARVLTLERIRGIKVSDLAALDAAGIDRKELAARAAGVILTMVFEHGFFHADPHPGNVFIEPGGRLALIDFGMVGTVDERTREHLAQVMLALSHQDAERLVDVVLDLGVARRRVDRSLLRQDLEHVTLQNYEKALGEVALGPLLEEVLAIVRRHRLQLPPKLALLLKTAIMSEGLGAQLDPDFRLTTVLTPFAERLLLQQYSPQRWARRLGQATLDAGRLSVELPHLVRRLMGELERGSLEVGVRPASYEPVLASLERLVNRLVLGVLAAAFIVGLAILMTVSHPAGWEQWAGAFFAIGFAIAGALGAYLAWSILRSGRS